MSRRQVRGSGGSPVLPGDRQGRLPQTSCAPPSPVRACRSGPCAGGRLAKPGPGSAAACVLAPRLAALPSRDPEARGGCSGGPPGGDRGCRMVPGCAGRQPGGAHRLPGGAWEVREGDREAPTDCREVPGRCGKAIGRRPEVPGGAGRCRGMSVLARGARGMPGLAGGPWGPWAPGGTGCPGGTPRCPGEAEKCPGGPEVPGRWCPSPGCPPGDGRRGLGGCPTLSG